MSGTILPVILAGGSGTRLWPLSRELYPKQFLRLIDDRTMLQNTLARLEGLAGAPPYIVCNDEHRFLVAEQARELDCAWGALILEPVGRNTAPAIALAALHAVKRGEDPVLVVLPADHNIADLGEFQTAVADAVRLAGDGHLVTFGVVPRGGETGYGYIRAGQALTGEPAAMHVAEFVEKPDAERAQAFLDAGGYYWNSGMFVFRAQRYLEELNNHRPDIHEACEAAIGSEREDLDFFRPGPEFGDCPSDSIDYAVMEKTSSAVVLPVDFGWSDVGSWDAVWRNSDLDDHGNAHRGDVISIDSRNSFVHADERLVAVIGVDDLVVVETADAVLVAAKDRVQDVKDVVSQIEDGARYEHHLHKQVFRPWGSYKSVEDGERYQVKRINVNPGEHLSLQMHHHRSEHWIVVRGTALVERGEERFMLSENESTYIPLGTKHRLSNPGKVPLELIEVQVGSYLGEDDIVRFEDQYGRVDDVL